MKKDFDKLSVRQLKHIHSIFHQQQLSNDEVSKLVDSHNEFFDTLSTVQPWSHLYELPYRTFLAVCAVAFDLTDAFHSIANLTENKTQAFIDYFDNMPDSIDEDLSIEDKGFRISLFMAVSMQLASTAIHSKPLSQLVSEAKEGDDNALFDAVLVDRSVVSAPSIAHRIQAAQLNRDESFMVSLSKAITKTRPRRPQKKYDDLRYMIEVIEEEIGFKNVSRDKIYDILIDELQLYDGTTDGLEKFIQRRMKKHKT